MPRVICLDVGTVRIGAAVSDPLGLFAQGIAVWNAAGPWLDELERTFARYGTDRLLLGLPIREDGTIGPSAQHVRDVAAQIQARFPAVRISYADERYSTRVATAALLEANVSRKKRKKSVDKIAAAVILQSWLEREGADCH